MHTSFPVRRLTLALGFIACLLGLSACATPPPPQFPELTYTHLPTITLGVAKIEVVSTSKKSDAAPHIEISMPVTPEQTVRNWARDRLRASGVSGVAKVIIENASVTETELARSKGLKGVFTTEQSQRYDANLKVSIRLEGVPRVSEAFAQAEIKRSQTVPEDVSVNVREQALFDLTENVMKDFDPAMAASIRKHLADFIR